MRVNVKRLPRTVFILCGLLCLVAFPAFSWAHENNPRFLLIHLDGISSEVFYSELEKGNLPHLESTFSDHGMIRHGITYFPPITTVVVSRIKEGKGKYEGPVVGWGGYEREEEQVYGMSGAALRSYQHMFRRSYTHTLGSYPGWQLHPGLNFLQAPDLLDKYPAVALYWFSTDAYGHRYGKEAQIQELYRFDSTFGMMMDRVDRDVNIVVYSDHGMIFGEHEDPKERMQELLGDEFITYANPNLFLSQDADHEDVARTLITEEVVDFTFFQKEDGKVVGYHSGGRMVFEEENGKIRYIYQGKDPFGYYQGGYDGSYLSYEDWLELTHSWEYPVAPHSVYNFLQNPDSGDVLAVVEAEYDPQGLGEHYSLHARDMRVPVLLRGAELEHLYDREYIRLSNLVPEIPALEPEDFEKPVSKRERHSVYFAGINTDPEADIYHFEGTYSPAYRWRISAATRGESDARAWAKYDLLSTFNSRIWLGGGVAEEDWDPELELVAGYEFSLLDFTAYYRGHFSTGSGENFWGLGWEVAPGWELELRDLDSLGLRFSW